MISYKNENGNVKELAAQGSMKDLLAESAYLLTAVYSMLARRDKAVAEIFKVSMMMAVGWYIAVQYVPMAPRFYRFSDFGKTVFLTYEEAKAALEAMKDE